MGPTMEGEWIEEERDKNKETELERQRKRKQKQSRGRKERKRLRVYEQRRMRMSLIQTGGNDFLTECLMAAKGRDAELEHEKDIRSEKEP